MNRVAFVGLIRFLEDLTNYRFNETQLEHIDSFLAPVDNNNNWEYVENNTKLMSALKTANEENVVLKQCLENERVTFKSVSERNMKMGRDFLLLLDLLAQGPNKKIDAIKMLRNILPIGLKEAKDYVEAIEKVITKS